MSDKKHLRKILKEKRQSFSLAERQQASDAITKNVVALSAYQRAKIIGLYCSTTDEVSTEMIIQASLDADKSCYLPVIDEHDHGIMRFALLDEKTTFKLNRFHIPEPESDCFIEASSLDFVIVPLLGFDANGHRLGMGAGYYDRAFHGVDHPILCGMAFEHQRVDFVPSDEWDVVLDYVVTEKQIYARP